MIIIIMIENIRLGVFKTPLKNIKKVIRIDYALIFL